MVPVTQFSIDLVASAVSRYPSWPSKIAIGGDTVFDSTGWLVDEDTTTVDVATIDFLATGGDDYDFGDASFERLGVTYEQGVLNYLNDELGGVITEAQYPNVTGTRIIQDG
ncbi:MAG: hypothetical protein ACLFWH_00835 [Actinomycetota bacterium]